ncbi:PLP-dependent transferase [Marasmius fiardii PR-910]|nr:PLP-dependent transferase [Marasmius fiardii PR-910]
MIMDTSIKEVRLSKRGQQRALDIGDSFVSSTPRSGQFYDEKRNPEGVIRVDIAENLLMTDVLLKHIHDHFQLTVDHLRYRIGLANGFEPTLDEALPQFLNRSLKPWKPIAPDETAVGPGVGSLLSQLLWILADVGEGILLTTPFYLVYPRDIVYPSQAVPVAVHVPPDIDPLSPSVLPFIRQTVKEQESQNKKCSVLILCNPHNPIGRAYPVETIKGYAAIAEELNLHLVVDELFANEVFPSRFSPSPTEFKSILSFDPTELQCNPSRIHVLAGLGKDFGAAGLKIGVLVSQSNPTVVECLHAALLLVPVSSASDAIFTSILNDKAFCEDFLKENRIRLGKAFEILADWCNFHELPFSTTEAGLFSLVDFASLIQKCEDQTLPLEAQVTNAVSRMKRSGVLLASNQALTRFRVIFSFPEKLMKLVLFRVEKAFFLPHYQW